MIYHIYKAIRLIFSKLTNVANHCITWLKLKGNNVSFSSFIMYLFRLLKREEHPM